MINNNLDLNAAKYGMEAGKRSYNGKEEYNMLLFDEAGKKFLLDNIEKIAGFKA